jgi:shikimate dehydrogenase
MQNAALRAAGIEVRYEARDVLTSELSHVLAELTARGAAGNVTIPHKSAVASACSRLEPLAQRTGAVNTFWTEQGQLSGANTYVDGVDFAVRELLGELPAGITVALLGAGGSAAAVAAAVERWGDCRLLVYNRTADRAQALSRRFGGAIAVSESLATCLSGADLVVNATSVGLYDDSLPFPCELLAPDAVVLDLVYRSGETALVRAARARGHRAADGLPVLLGQGAASFTRWFGVEPDRHVMWHALHPRRPG